MKANRIHAHGGMDQLRLDELEMPRPGSRRVAVEIKAAALNHLDLFVRKGLPGVPLPVILGADASGVIRHLGSAVTPFRTMVSGSCFSRFGVEPSYQAGSGSQATL